MKITIEAVEKRYGDVVALAGPSFEIPTGSTFGVLGTNGAGKTTLFELLVGHDVPDAGDITLGGLHAADAGPKLRQQVGYLPEQVGFPPLLSGREVLTVHARARQLGPERDDRVAEVLETVGLTEAADRKIAGYSNGMRGRLGLAAALLAEPPVLVLDEPTAGLDPRGVETFHRLIERVSTETNATVVVSSHVLSEVERLCDSVAILHEGTLCAAGSVDELAMETDVQSNITLRPVDDAAERLWDVLGRYGSVNEQGDRLVLTCPGERLLELLGELANADVDGIEVSEPGLDTAFHAAIDDTVDGSSGVADV